MSTLEGVRVDILANLCGQIDEGSSRHDAKLSQLFRNAGADTDGLPVGVFEHDVVAGKLKGRKKKLQ